MEENVMTEQDLSEELLQQITGGCGDCKSDKDTVTRYQHLNAEDGVPTFLLGVFPATQERK